MSLRPPPLSFEQTIAWQRSLYSTKLCVNPPCPRQRSGGFCMNLQSSATMTLAFLAAVDSTLAKQSLGLKQDHSIYGLKTSTLTINQYVSCCTWSLAQSLNVQLQGSCYLDFHCSHGTLIFLLWVFLFDTIVLTSKLSHRCANFPFHRMHQAMISACSVKLARQLCCEVSQECETCRAGPPQKRDAGSCRSGE